MSFTESISRFYAMQSLVLCAQSRARLRAHQAVSCICSDINTPVSRSQDSEKTVPDLASLAAESQGNLIRKRLVFV